MEKIIIILVILAILYYINTYLKTTEGFEGATQSLSGIDDANSINTLAQISRQLMAGGVTVPGSMNIQGDLVFPNPTTIKGAGRLHIGGEELLYLLNKKGVMIGKEWGGTGDLTVQGSTGIAGNASIGGDLNFPNQTTIKGAGRLHVTGEELLYILNKKGVMIGKEWGGTGDLQVQGNILAQGRNILGEIDAINNRKIIITHAQYGPDLATTGVALDHEAHKANSNGSYAFDYRIGTQWNGGGYDPQPYVAKGFFCAFKCGLNGNVQQIGRGAEAGGQVIRIAC